MDKFAAIIALIRPVPFLFVIIVGFDVTKCYHTLRVVSKKYFRFVFAIDIICLTLHETKANSLSSIKT